MKKTDLKKGNIFKILEFGPGFGFSTRNSSPTPPRSKKQRNKNILRIIINVAITTIFPMDCVYNYAAVRTGSETILTQGQ